MSSTIAQDFNNYYCQFLSGTDAWSVGLFIDACIAHGEELGMAPEDVLAVIQTTCGDAAGVTCELTD